MKIQQTAVLLTVVNLLLLASTLTQLGAAPAREVSPFLRVRGLEIVDEQGRKRAEVVVFPPSIGKDGKKGADTVLFRLIDPNGRPGVKIGTSEEGSGISLAGDSEKRDWSGVQLLADGTASVVKLTNKDGTVQLIKP